MSRFRLLGIVLIAIVLAPVFSASAKKTAKYVGSEQCIMCHEGMHEGLVKAYLKTSHHQAMIDAAKNPKALVGKFDASAPFKKEDVKYVLGLGRVCQNYLYKDMKLLPGRWDAIERKWVKIDAADGATQCMGCHATNFDPETKKWTELGVGCESCHGPGAAHAESMNATDIIKLNSTKGKQLVNGLCLACHASKIGSLKKHAPTAGPSDTCATCHMPKGSHRFEKVK